MYVTCPDGRIPAPPFARNSTLLGVYTPLGCSSSTLFWLSDARFDSSYHRWPGVMSAFGGLDGAGVALRFFQNVLAGPMVSPFRGLVANLSPSLACHALMSPLEGAICLSS